MAMHMGPVGTTTIEGARYCPGAGVAPKRFTVN